MPMIKGEKMMKKTCMQSLVLVVFLIFMFGCAKDVQQEYLPDWESLSKHNEAPQWFRDAKFGIYFHWGVYSVPAYNSEWYPRHMHMTDHEVYQYHVKTYGEPSEFGYHDFIPMFKAEKFNADEWAELFKNAGARFAGPVAEHHDGFSMWDSKLTPWNSMIKGPKRDITGDMARAVRAHGMKFITTFHHAFNFQHHPHPVDDKATGYYTNVEGWPTASNDPELRLLYGNLAATEFYTLWKGKLFEVIDNYRPDLIWFDFVLGDIPEQHRMEFLAHYFNKAFNWNQEVVVTFKGDDLPKEVGVEDFEKGRLDHLTEYPWLTDDTISWGSWCYTQDLEIKTFKTVLHTLIDIVSKNGVLLLNISPMADGTIPENQEQILLDLGQWLNINGEAIYSTRPWKVYGQGPTKMEKSGHFVGRVDYTAEDIRFTSSKDQKTLYAIVLGTPGKSLTIQGARVSNIDQDAEVILLGSDQEIEFNLDDEQNLRILPSLLLSEEDAYVFKISGFTFELIR